MQPQIVLLQEAFTDDAKAIGVKAGYRHILSGPNKASPQMPGLSAGDVGFARDASWFKGEDIGHWVDSGLVILSDYPITRGRQAIFPNDLCAGFDCIASKGVQLAWVNIPGRASPLAIVNTHLNSRRSSGVSIPRANKALMQQFSAARQFIEKNLPTDASAIFAGDFNVGRDEQRIRHANQVGGPLPGAREALTDALAQDRVESVSRADARKSRRNGKDLQFYRSTASFPFQLANLRVVFGTIGVGGHLSDHIGYAAEYSLH
ncbi:MAG: endonuclease/exonuclease/phosphatase family protein [Novosphingobium sp.]|nr:endonuclease/exonuclease/phosphatase family protein [Novosphingobium sp.]